MEKTLQFLKDAKVYYLATVDGDQPRVRPFGTVNIFDGKLYIQTGKVKDVSRQLHANPKVNNIADMDRSLEHHGQSRNYVRHKVLGAQRHRDSQRTDGSQDYGHADSDVRAGEDQKCEQSHIFDKAFDQSADRFAFRSREGRTDGQQETDQNHSQQDLPKENQYARKGEEIESLLPGA